MSSKVLCIIGHASIPSIRISYWWSCAVTATGSPWTYQWRWHLCFLCRGDASQPQAFKDMVQRCKKAGVDIYVDAVINHVAEGPGTLGDTMRRGGVTW